MISCRECQQPASAQAFQCPHCGAPYPARPKWDGWGFEYRSTASVLGWPLLHISFKYRPNRVPVLARGIFAIGQFAVGVFTLAGILEDSRIHMKLALMVLVVSQALFSLCIHNYPGLVGEARFKMAPNQRQDIIARSDQGQVSIVCGLLKANEAFHAVGFAAHLAAELVDLDDGGKLRAGAPAATGGNGI